MKFGLWTQYGALNSKPVFDALRHSLIQAGHSVVDNHPNNDVDVIWSVLWHGRMAQNKLIWNRARAANKPIIVLEVGHIQRGITWKVGLNGINRDAFFGPRGNNNHRASVLALELKEWQNNTNGPIIICTQHSKSQQWANMPTVRDWAIQTVDEIRRHTDRHIVIRSHPRCPLPMIELEFKHVKNISRDLPIKINGTYDDYNFKYDHAWAVVNWSSNPAVEAVRNGIPVFVGPSSLAWDVGNRSLDTINSPSKPDRQQWLNDLAWTEFTVQEIAQGLPLKQLTSILI
jgi:hypothetical protein